MNYIIFDLEFNQKHPDNKDISSTLTFEIIQIGAIKLDKNFNTVDTFNELIKPTVYSAIHPYVENLTNITIDKVSSCKNFPEVYENFLKFIGSEKNILVVWGSGDLRELYRNIEFHNIENTLRNSKYIDIQNYASKYFNCPKGNKIGLKNAINLLNICTDKIFHNAFNDAYYTAEVFKCLYNTKIKSKFYKIPPKSPILQPKQELDTAALFSQFEKIYNRSMTIEEKEIIKLAYMMGKTKQFIKK